MHLTMSIAHPYSHTDTLTCRLSDTNSLSATLFQIDLRVAKSVTCGLALSRELLIGSSVGAGEDI